MAKIEFLNSSDLLNRNGMIRSDPAPEKAFENRLTPMAKAKKEAAFIQAVTGYKYYTPALINLLHKRYRRTW